MKRAAQVSKTKIITTYRKFVMAHSDLEFLSCSKASSSEEDSKPSPPTTPKPNKLKKTEASTDKKSPVTLTQHWADSADSNNCADSGDSDDQIQNNESYDSDGNDNVNVKDDTVSNLDLVVFLTVYIRSVQTAVQSVREVHPEYGDDAFEQETFFLLLLWL